MRVNSTTLAELIEPTLFSLRRPSHQALAALVERALTLVAEKSSVLGRDLAALHQPSYEFGVATTFAELLSTAEQRSEFGDAAEKVRGLEWAQRLLHELALIERHGIPVRQQSLAQQLEMDRGNLSRRIQKLIALHLIERRAAGLAGSHFCLTALGRDVLDDLVPGWQADNPATRECFTSDEAAATAATSILERHLREMIGARIREFPMLYDQAIKVMAHSTSPPSNHALFGVSKAATVLLHSAPFTRAFFERTDEVVTVGKDFVVERGCIGGALSR